MSRVASVDVFIDKVNRAINQSNVDSSLMRSACRVDSINSDAAADRHTGAFRWQDRVEEGDSCPPVSPMPAASDRAQGNTFVERPIAVFSLRQINATFWLVQKRFALINRERVFVFIGGGANFSSKDRVARTVSNFPEADRF